MFVFAADSGNTSWTYLFGKLQCRPSTAPAAASTSPALPTEMETGAGEARNFKQFYSLHIITDKSFN